MHMCHEYFCTHVPNMHAFMQGCMHACGVCVCMHVCMYVCMHKCMSVSLHLCIYVYMHVWHLGSFTAANWVSFNFNVSYSYC